VAAMPLSIFFVDMELIFPFSSIDSTKRESPISAIGIFFKTSGVLAKDSKS